MSTVIVIGEVDGNDVKDVSQQVAAVASGMGDVVGIICLLYTSPSPRD